MIVVHGPRSQFSGRQKAGSDGYITTQPSCVVRRPDPALVGTCRRTGERRRERLSAVVVEDGEVGEERRGGRLCGGMDDGSISG